MAQTRQLEKASNPLEACLFALQRGRLGHALIFKLAGFHKSQVSGAPLRKILWPFISRLLCASAKSPTAPCGHCDSCSILESAHEGLPAHPDFSWMELEPSAKAYTVEEIRKLTKFFSHKLQLSPRRVLIIEQAEKLSVAASNALLKLLEEPRPNTHLVLVSSNASSMLATIQSRCQQFLLPRSLLEKEADQLDLSPPLEPQWQQLADWLSGQKAAGMESPLDQESFWKDRASATRSLEELSSTLWQQYKTQIDSLDRQQALTGLDLFAAIEALWQGQKNYRNANLQWLEEKLKIQAGVSHGHR